jgi:iron complex transport system ATP-binding protein
VNALEVQNLACGYEDKVILRGLSFTVKTGEFVGVVGANGSGKTTLLRAICGLLPLQAGEIRINSKEMLAFDRKAMASLVAFVPQLMEPIEGFSVMETVLLGRMPYLERFEFEGEEDRQVAKWAIEELQITDLAGKDVTHLSGGEFQRVAIARALAQEPKIMLLDEPISHLDIRYQIKILKLLRKIRAQRTVIATFHDLNMASRFCQKLILLKRGELIAAGYPDEVVTAENIWKAYRVRAQVKKNPRTKHASLVFLP